MRVGEMGTQAVQNSETMCVNIAPILHVDGPHPRDVRQPFESVPQPEYDDTFSAIGKRQAVDPILGNEDSLHRNRQNCEVLGW
jgi:hypothetical protein